VRKSRATILVVVLAAAVIVPLAAMALRPKAIEVETAVVAPGTVEEIVVNSEGGTVKTRARARLGVESYGRVAEITRREGGVGRAGEVLLRLEPTTERTRLTAAERNLEVARATLVSASSTAKLAEQNHGRVKKLRDQNLATPEQLDEADAKRDAAAAEARAAKARVESAESAVQLARDDLTHVEIRAPFDGVLAHLMTEVGERVIPGQTLLEWVSLSRLYASAPIDERDAGRLHVGLPVRITVDTYPGVVWTSRLTRISPVVEVAKEQNRTQEIEADFPADTTLPVPSPGMTADVEIVLERKAGVLRIPTVAVLEGTRVYVAEKDRLATRAIGTGIKSWEWTEVRSGLDAGDRVITSVDRAGLRDGVRVASRDRPAAGSGSGSGAGAPAPP
jgi:HlyD family secretion protein